MAGRPPIRGLTLQSHRAASKSLCGQLVSNRIGLNRKCTCMPYTSNFEGTVTRDALSCSCMRSWCQFAFQQRRQGIVRDRTLSKSFCCASSVPTSPLWVPLHSGHGMPGPRRPRAVHERQRPRKPYETEAGWRRPPSQLKRFVTSRGVRGKCAFACSVSVLCPASLEASSRSLSILFLVETRGLFVVHRCRGTDRTLHRIPPSSRSSQLGQMRRKNQQIPLNSLPFSCSGRRGTEVGGHRLPSCILQAEKSREIDVVLLD
jgi:hypothetical protein